VPHLKRAEPNRPLRHERASLPVCPRDSAGAGQFVIHEYGHVVGLVDVPPGSEPAANRAEPVGNADHDVAVVFGLVDNRDERKGVPATDGRDHVGGL
jgi:hypothetical protein